MRTRAFEAWMQRRTDVSRRLLKSKHRKMAAGAFPFLRATFCRWVERWPEDCPRLAERDEDVVLVAKIEMPENERDKRLALAPALLRLMGRETANIHLGSHNPDALEKL